LLIGLPNYQSVKFCFITIEFMFSISYTEVVTLMRCVVEYCIIGFFNTVPVGLGDALRSSSTHDTANRKIVLTQALAPQWIVAEIS